MDNLHDPSPCLSCNRVKDPRACNNKNCIPWRQWFTNRWESMQKDIRAGMDRVPKPPTGINIGGNYYVPPNQIHYYLDNDPCQRCLCSSALCATPCRVRRAWEEARKDVFL